MFNYTRLTIIVHQNMVKCDENHEIFVQQLYGHLLTNWLNTTWYREYIKSRDDRVHELYSSLNRGGAES